MRIYVLGNLLVKKDSLPIKLLPLLRKELPHDFLEFDPSENFPKNMIIIDTVENAEQVVLIEDISKIELNKACSLHDFDLGYNLKLMKKFGILEDVKIIGVPANICKRDAISGIKKIIASLSSESG